MELNAGPDTISCKHGSLKRSCYTCELEAESKRLQEENRTLLTLSAYHISLAKLLKGDLCKLREAALKVVRANELMLSCEEFIAINGLRILLREKEG